MQTISHRMIHVDFPFGRIMLLLKLNPKARANKKERGYEYHKEKVSTLTGPWSHGFVSQTLCRHGDEARENVSSPNPLQYHIATCPFSLILLLSQRSKWTNRYHTHASKISLSSQWRFSSQILRDSNLTLFSSLDRSHSQLPPIEEDEGFFSFSLRVLPNLALLSFLFIQRFRHHNFCSLWIWASLLVYDWRMLVLSLDLCRGIIRSGSGKMSQSIFHQTVLCQTQTVAEHQSKVSSFAVSVNKGKKNPVLRTNFRGNRLCVRKCKLAMGKHRHVEAIPRAVLTTNPASEVCSNHHNIMT